jgi:hypothetical protein
LSRGFMAVVGGFFEYQVNGKHVFHASLL